MAPVNVIDADGIPAVSTPTWFPDDEALGTEALTIVSVLGGQASGKSTLLNKLFATSFTVGSRAAVGAATTKGIYADKPPSHPSIVALDIEGSDSRERGRDGKVFQSRCAAFVAAISDILLLNVWYHDVGRFDAAGYRLLQAVFTEAAKTADQDPSRTALVFVVRDVDDDADRSSTERLLTEDANTLFGDVSKTENLATFFDISFVFLPHMRHREDAFNTECTALSKRITDSQGDSFLAQTAFSKGIPADGCGTFTRSLWETNYSTQSVQTTTGAEPAESADLITAYKCNEAFSDALMEASSKMNEFSSASLEAGEKIEGFGKNASEIMSDALKAYDEATEEFVDDSIQARKRRELESIIDTSQQATFMKQLQVLRENALAQFKSATASDDMPSDFAFYKADSLFLREAEESKRPGSSWSINQERTDLQNMMQEISTQRKRLLTSQVTAAQQQAHAMQYLQMQQSQMNAIQAQAYGGSAGQWNVGAAYRPPDTNINASLSYQQGRTNIQISMVPDESASLLGPNGFTSGVGPGNLGLSFNIGL